MLRSASHKVKQGGEHMARKFAKLQRIDNNEVITKDTNYPFLYHLQSALLLALKERGRLNAMQYRYAEEKLKQQRRDRAKCMLEKGESK